MDAEFTLGREEDDTSTLRVVETFVAVFPENQNRGLRREIPAEYNGQPTFPELVSVTDEAVRRLRTVREHARGRLERVLGELLAERRAKGPAKKSAKKSDATSSDDAAAPAEVETEGEWMTVTSRADDFLSGRQTFVFTYTLRNVTDSFADTSDEFYWDVNGNGWRQPFGEVTATLIVPPELADVGDPGGADEAEAEARQREGDRNAVERARDADQHRARGR